MPIIVENVPSGTRKPGAYVDINTRAAKVGLATTVDKVLLCGLKRSTGSTAITNELTRCYSPDEAKTLFGTGSPLALMVEAVLTENPYLAELWVLPEAENGAGTVAAGTLTVTSTGLTGGVLTVYIGHRSVQVFIAATDTNNTIAGAIQAALTSHKEHPFAYTVATNVVTCTALCKGAYGNQFVLRGVYTGTGLTITIVQPTGGAGDPNLSTDLVAAVPVQFDVIVSMFNDATNLAALKSHLDTISGAMEQRPGVGIAGHVGSTSNSIALAAPLNSGRVMIAAYRGTRTHPMELAAAVAGALAFESDRARPLNYWELQAVVAPDAPSNYYTRTEQESLLMNGITPLMVGPALVTQIVRTVSTYTLDTYGSADDTLLDIQTIRVLDAVRYAVRTKVLQELGRAKLADQAKTPNTTDPTQIRALIYGVLLQLQNDVGYLENVEANKDRLIVERDLSSATRINVRIPSDIVDGLHVFAASVDLILG